MRSLSMLSLWCSRKAWAKAKARLRSSMRLAMMAQMVRSDCSTFCSLYEEIKTLEEVPGQIGTHLKRHGGNEIFEFALIFYARSLGQKPLPDNIENLLVRQDKTETLELVSKYADYLESMSPLDAAARDVSEQQLFLDDWSNLGSEDLRMMIEVVWYRKNTLCSMDKDSRMTPDEKRNFLKSK